MSNPDNPILGEDGLPETEFLIEYDGDQEIEVAIYWVANASAKDRPFDLPCLVCGLDMRRRPGLAYGCAECKTFTKLQLEQHGPNVRVVSKTRSYAQE